MRFQLLNEHKAFNLLHILTKSTFYEGKLVFLIRFRGIVTFHMIVLFSRNKLVMIC
jgi:hypothetical protein